MMSAPTAIGLPDVANRALTDIKSRNELVRAKGTKALATFLEAEIREISGEKLSKLLGELNKRIGDLVSSIDVHEKLGGIEAIDTLLEIDCDEAMSQVFYFANHLRNMFPCADVQTMVMGSRALGHLAAKGGAVIADTIDFEIKRALEGLTGERQENRRLASVLVLKELAKNAPTLFNVYVAEFFDKIWTALRDPKEQVRIGAVDALRACLTLILERQSSMRVQWYYKIYDEAIKGLRQSSPENIHGSLLTIGELLRSTGDFLSTRFKDICDWVLRFKDHKDSLVRKTTISLVPVLAGFNPQAFVLSHLQLCATHMLTVMKKDKGAERSAAFLAFGELSQHSDPSSFLQFVDQFAVHLKDAISRPNAADPLPFQSLQLLVRSLGTAVTEMARDLVGTILSTPITKPAVVCLAHMAESITELHQQISSMLLDAISMVLQKKPFSETKDKSFENEKGSRAVTKGLKRTDSVGRSSDTLALALQTLGEFNFIGQPLLSFVCECVVTFLEDPNPAIRREAAASCSKLLLRPNSSDAASPSFAPRRGIASTVVAEVLEKLLVVGISDPEPSIRLTVLKALDSRYDYYLAQAQCIRSLFIAVNDENFDIREVVIQIIGRLTQRNPAYVMPTMRKMLIQLLTELEFGTESRQKEEAARLLRHLIHASQRLIKPYVQSILKVLHPRLRDSNSTVASCVLATLGELALVGAHEIRSYVDIFSLVIEALQDQGSVGKREVAVRTLVQLVQATGSAIEPYSKYPQLMGIIISGLQSEQSPPIRIELIRLLGTLGALDPIEYKQIQMQAKNRQSDVVKNQIFADEDEVAIVPSNEDYYPSVAISALIKILRDSTLATHHPSVSQAIMKIFQAMGIRCVQFLPKVMPPFLALINSAEFGLRDNLFMQLGHLVSVVKQHIRPYLDDIFSLIDGLWTVPTLHNQILSLVEEISSALKDEFKSCVPDLLPHMLNILNNRSERDTSARGPSSANMNAEKVLQVLKKFDSNLDDYLHLVVPSVVRLAELADNSPDLQKAAVKWLGDMCPSLNFSDFASRIIHPLTRMLDTGTPEIKREVIVTLTAVATELGSDFLVFRNLISSCISRNNLSTANAASQDVVSKYEAVVSRISRGLPVTESTTSSASVSFIASIEEPYAAEILKKIAINPHNLRKAWESSQRITREDWTEWIRRFSVELLRESSSPALRCCSALAQVYTPLARELFNAAFVSCWSELADTFQQALVASVGLAFDTEKAPNVPPEVLQILLNLAEFMEHDEHPLPIDVRRLGEVAEKCQAFAKALHYKEHEFKSAPQATIGSLISINYQLNQPEAADGILVYAKNQQASSPTEVHEEWYEKLRQWDEALNAYESRLEKVPSAAEKDKVHAGIVRCLYNVGDWQSLHDKAVNLGDRAVSPEVAWMATMSAWHLNQWESMRHFSDLVDEKSIEGSYFRAVLAVHHNDFSLAESWIEKSRSILDTKLTALVGESYERAYDSVVRAMEICELEEVLTLKRLSPDLRQSHLDRLKLCWNARLHGCQASVDVWHRVLAARSVVIAPHSDLESWAKFCSLCIKSRKRLLASNTIMSLMRASSGAAGKAFSPSLVSSAPVLEVFDALSSHADPRISYVSMKFLWNFDQQDEALVSMRRFVEHHSDGASGLAGRLQARCHLRIGEWTRSSTDALNESSIAAILNSYRAATELDPSWGKAWHSWALMNYDVIQWLLDHQDKPELSVMKQAVPATAGFFKPISLAQDLELSVIKHAIPAITGFFKSISLAQDAALQDILRLLTLWFKHGANPEVEQVLIEGFNSVDITTWLEVIPQIIARINTPAAPIRKLINDVLCRVGHEHPQALIYPLTVAAKSQSVKRKAAADAVMGHMLQFSPTIVNQAVLVSQELIRVAILWHEIWHEALEEASRLFFSEKNIDGMFQVLEPVHAMMEKGAETVRETSFMQLFGRDLTDANDCCLRYKAKKAKGLKEERDLNQAWDLYYHVYKNITKQLPQMTTLELQYVSPKLLEARELDLCVPGTYKAGRDIVSISSFAPTLTVMVSKQRPRRCTIHGSNGIDYQFLLKGHEDLRQDERVMQLFGLVNTLLSNDRDCCRQELNIQRYSVIPLSPKSGLIEWVPNCDTLHALIKDYRDSKKALVTIEHRIILQMAPDFEHLPLIKKIEVFRHTLEQTTGLDLYKVLWLKSRNSEVWLERRTNFTRSLAVMSMVGYILGLGDRHPSNLMLHKYTGKVLHIDFGDCFEVATKREKFPEKIPFRLTRMLTKAMEVSGIEGNFRFTCKNVMRVLREHRPSVMAMLEAFVYDPLINWRLLEATAVKPMPASSVEGSVNPGAAAGVAADAPPGLQGEDLVSMQRPTHHRDEREIGKLIAMGEEGDGALSEVRNSRAVTITKRVQDKLTGRDFENEAEPLDIDSQVARLISEAISEANLSQVRPPSLCARVAAVLSNHRRH